MSSIFYEISEKVQKSLITPIMNRLHRLECIETKEKSVESFFKICVIGEQKLVFQSSLYIFLELKVSGNVKIFLC